MGVTCIIGVYIVCSTSVLYEEVTVRNVTVGTWTTRLYVPIMQCTVSISM